MRDTEVGEGPNLIEGKAKGLTLKEDPTVPDAVGISAGVGLRIVVMPLYGGSNLDIQVLQVEVSYV